MYNIIFSLLIIWTNNVLSSYEHFITLHIIISVINKVNYKSNQLFQEQYIIYTVWFI